MKHVLNPRRLSLFALALFALFLAGCTTDGLVVQEGEAYLQLGEQKSSFAKDGSVYRLRMQDGLLVAKEMKGLKASDALQCRQFGKLQPLSAGSYQVELPSREAKPEAAGQGFTFIKGNDRLEVKGRLGMLITYWDDKFQYAISGADESTTCARKPVTFTSDRITFNGKSAHNFFTWESETVLDDDGNVVQRRQLMGDVETPTVPNDTGIEIIIVETFTPANCCDETFLSCTEDSGDPVEVPASTPADGWAIASTHYIGHACVYEACGHVIVADQVTGEIRCYNSEICTIRVQHHHDGTFSVLWPSDCDSSACVTICPAKKN